MSFSTLISSIGVLLILVAFLLSIFKLLSIESKWYYALNSIGGGFACYGSFLLDSLPFILLDRYLEYCCINRTIKKLKKGLI